MKPDDLPVEALKAGIAAWNENQGGSYTNAFRMVIVEAIKAWPDAEMLYGSEDDKLYSVILPVPEEKAMAKDWTEQKAIELLENEVKRLREALQLIIDHPVAASGQWFVGVKEMKKVARAALEKNDD